MTEYITTETDFKEDIIDLYLYYTGDGPHKDEVYKHFRR